MDFAAESDALKKSAWPRCDALADGLAAHGARATEALEKAAASRTHHVRSASLRALAKVNKERAIQLAHKLLDDRAYEVRETAEGILTGFGEAIPEAKRVKK